MENKEREEIEIEDNECEWCGANLSKGETCNDSAHYTNR
jgi:hypothetical protein